jgi:hypothetical protein
MEEWNGSKGQNLDDDNDDDLTMLPVLDYTSSSGRMIVEFERI